MKAFKFKATVLMIAGIAFTGFLPVKAQQVDTLSNLPNLLLPRFTTGIVKLKSGLKSKGILNYNLVGEQMVFLQRNQTLILREPQLVDTIYLSNRIFVPFEEGFYEVLVSSGEFCLFRQNKAHFEIPGTPIGYGLTSRTVTPQYYQQVHGPTGIIDLKIPEDYKVVDDSQFWIRINNEMYNFKTKKQFIKIFPEKQKELEKFITQNKIDFKQTEDVKKVFLYAVNLK